jgi:uncharacterized membrane protein YphA (DoxX/SURF4 family)
MPDYLDLGLWALQIVVSALFLLAGYGHLIAYARTREKIAWIRDVPEPVVRAIGVAELAGAVGVVAPHATGILPWLTPVAAAGLALLMLGAVGFHVRRKEWGYVGLVGTQALLAAIVAYGRYVLAP